MEEWKEYKLGEIIDFTSGGTPNKNTPKFWNGDIPWISAKTMYVDFVSTSDLFITQEGLEAGSKLAPKGTILLLTRGSGLFNTIPICKVVSPVAFNQDVKCLYSRNEGIISNDFLFYWLKGNEQTITNILETTGIGAGKIDTKRFLDLPIKLPSLKEQEKLVEIASSLFEKIKINNAINENLEQQAQALFKSWFVDFEPFRDQPFVESELGMIPEGWRVDVFDSIIKDIIPGDWGKEKEEGNYTHKVACIRGCDFQDIKNGLRGKTPERYILEKNYTAKRFQDHDVLVEISGGTPTISTGRVCPISQKLIELYDSDIVCTNFCKVIRPMKGYGAFLYYSWLYKFNNKVMFGYENGTSGIKNFRLKDFTSIEPVVIPPLKEIERFQELIDTIHLQIQTRGTESSRLSHLRDTLLPKLMSGEITL